MALVARADFLERPADVVVYPESDGQPIADNTKQFEWIVTIQGGLAALFRERDDVFVAGDLLWYPVEGRPGICIAPDVLVAFGRPPGHRRSYLQWAEDGIVPQVVFEVLSHSNTAAEMTRKFWFYDRHGVEEYYLYDPDGGELSGWLRRDGRLEEVVPISGWISPRLGVRFEWQGADLQIIGPDGAPFATYVELAAQRVEERQRAEEERQRAEEEHQRAERLTAQLRALGVEPEHA